MTRRLSHIALLLMTLAPLARAGEVAGVTLPDSVTVQGKTLKLNGMGLRRKIIFKVYVAGLYLESPSHDANHVISSDQIKRMELSALRSLDRHKVTEAINEGFEKKNSGAQLAALRSRLDRLNSWIPNVETGDSIVLTYVPGKGTIVSARLQEKGVIEGKDFADALFAVWLGPDPVQEDLKRELLGRDR